MRQSRLLDESRLNLGLILILFAGSGICRVLVTLVDVFSATKVVQPAEFAAGAALFSAYPALSWALLGLATGNALLLLIQAKKLWPHSRTGGLLRILTAAGQIWTIGSATGLLVSGLLVLAIFLRRELLVLRDHPQKPTLHEGLTAVAGFQPIKVLSHLPGMTLCSVIGIAILGGAEAWLSTARHVDLLFSRDDFVIFLLQAGIGGILVSLRWALEICLVAITMGAFAEARTSIGKRFLFAGITFASTYQAWTSGWEWPIAMAILGAFDFWCRRAETENGLHRFLAPALIGGLYVGVRLQGYLLGILIDEIRALDLVVVVYAGLLPFSVLLVIWTQIGLRHFFARCTPSSIRCRDGAVAITTSALTPWLGPWWLSRKSTTLPAEKIRVVASILGLLILTIVIWALVKLNYPILSDFSQVAQPMWASLLGAGGAFFLILVLIGLAGIRPPFGLRSWIALGCLLALSIVVWQRYAQQEGPRMIAAQHAKILRQMLDSVGLLRTEVIPDLTTSTKLSDDPHGLLSTGNYPTVPPQEFYQTRRPPVFFILWDGARPDHLSYHGYHRSTTPHAEALAADGIVFEQAYSNATATTTSVRKMFSGHYSSRYMLSKNHQPFFTGALVEHGYDRIWVNVDGSDYNGVSTEAFTRCQPNEQKVAQAVRSFRAYEEIHKTRKTIELLDQELEERANRTHPADGLFFYLHCASMHFPWRYWSDHQDYGREPIDLYDNSIGHADNALGLLIAALKERGIYDDAIIVLTADHGTGLGDHGKYGGFQPYEEQIRVPLLVKAPGFSPHRVSSPVALLDVAPTFLSLFEPGGKNPYDGWSLLELMDGQAKPLPRRYLASLCAFEDAFALLDLQAGWKLHLHRTEGYRQLYQLQNDPLELNNVIDDHPEHLDRMTGVAFDFLRAGLDSYANPFHYRGWEVPQ